MSVTEKSAKVNDNNTDDIGTISLITRKEGCIDASLVEIYFNGNKSRMMVDTGAGASIIHYADDPEQDRIFKIENRKTYYLPYQYDVNWREIGDVKPASPNGIDYDEIFWSSDEEDKDDGDDEIKSITDQVSKRTGFNASDFVDQYES